jgi:hypothetical protein
MDEGELPHAGPMFQVLLALQSIPDITFYPASPKTTIFRAIAYAKSHRPYEAL